MTVDAKRNANRLATYGLILTAIGIALNGWLNTRQQIKSENDKLNEKLDKIIIISQALTDHIAADTEFKVDTKSRIATIEKYFIEADEPTIGRKLKKQHQLFTEY